MHRCAELLWSVQGLEFPPQHWNDGNDEDSDEEEEGRMKMEMTYRDGH